MESLKEILNKRKQQGFFSVDSINDPYLDDCKPCNQARWIIVNNETVPCNLCDKSFEDDIDIKIRIKYAGLDQLMEYKLINFKVDGSVGKSEPSKLRNYLNLAKDYSKNPMGWLVINGPTGTGKTHLAAGIAINCVENSSPVIYKSIQEIVDIITNTNPEDESFKDLINFPFLVIDDFGNQRYSDWIEEKIDHLFTHRYTRKLPTVIALSSNILDLDDRSQMRFTDPKLVQSINPVSYTHLTLPTKA